jgi:hypothetical protein
MFVFARRIEHALDVAVQRSHDADAREHRRSVLLGDQQERFHRGLPFVGIVFGLGQFGDVLGGIAQRAQGLAIDTIGSKNS